MRLTVALSSLVIALAATSTAQAHLPKLCSKKQSPKVEMACGKYDLASANSTLRFLKQYPHVGDRWTRDHLWRDHEWLKKYAQWHIKHATERTHPYVDSCTRTLLGREGGWNPHKWNGGHVERWRPGMSYGSGAYGGPQARPADKMASAGPDWADNIWTQIKWMIGYEYARWGSPCAALAHSYAHGWY